MTDILTRSARGRPCMIRVPGYCSGDPETVVLCHLRLSGLSGMGLKCDSLLAAFGCHACHEVCDGRVQSPFTYAERRLMLLEGIARTQTIWLAEGLITINKRRAA